MTILNDARQHAALKNNPFLPKKDHAVFHGICAETASLRISGDFLHSDTWPMFPMNLELKLCGFHVPAP